MANPACLCNEEIPLVGDREQVEYAALGLLNFLPKFRPRLRRNSLHVNTHSMGTYLLVRALVDYARIDAIPDTRNGAPLIDEMTFFAADLSNNSLEKDEDGYHAVQEADRLTSYFYRIIGRRRSDLKKTSRIGLEPEEDDLVDEDCVKRYLRR